MKETYRDLEIKLIGEHQINNSILAISVIKYLKDINKLANINEESIRKGLINTKFTRKNRKDKRKSNFYNRWCT